MKKTFKFALYGFVLGIIYSIFSVGSFLLCKLTGIGQTIEFGIHACNVNPLLQPFAVFYRSFARGKGLFFTATNFVLIGEVIFILLAFTIAGLIIGLIYGKMKNSIKK